MSEQLSGHVARRCASRGVTGQLLAMLLSHADVEVPVGGGAWALSMSRTAREVLAEEGIAAQQLDRLGRLVAVIADAKVVTVLHPRGRRGKAYRRGRK